jgi:copper resistance protein C
MRRNTAFRWVAQAGFAAVVVVAALAWSAAPASAHNYPVAYSPAEGAVVREQPGVISVTTNDNLLNLDGAGSGMAMQIHGPMGAAKPLYYGDGCVTVFGPTVETTAQLGAPGVYKVIWQVVSTDGHPVSGKYTFTWQPAAGQQLATGSATPPDCNGTMSVATGQGGSTQSTGAAAGTGQTPAEQGESAMMSELLWVGGAFAAVVVAVLATLLLVRRKPAGRTGSNDPGNQTGPTDPTAPADPVDPQ